MANPALTLLALVQVAFPHGRVIDSVRSQADSGERYAIYLPARYDSTRHWPLLFVMDPRGRAKRALERFRDGAERDGWVVLSSYNTVSDSTEEPNTRALNAALIDAPKWFAIDARRIYLAGFSGTARLDWAYGIELRGHVAGVLGFGAGLPWFGGLAAYLRLRDSITFAFYGGAGSLDFNYDEVHRLESTLDSLGTIPHRFSYYEGPHAWPPAPVGASAIDWMELQAMKSGLAPRSDSALAAWYDSRVAAARVALDSGELFQASRRYSAVRDDFRGLHDVSMVTALADSLGRIKAVRAEASRRRSLAEASDHYLSVIIPRFVTEVDSAPRPPTLERSLALLDLRDLQRRARDSTDRLGSQAARRLLTSVFVNTAFYMPRAYLARGDAARAVAVLDVARTIDSTDSDVRDGLARAHAMQQLH